MPVALISTRTSPAFGPSRSSSTISSGFFAWKATAARVFIVVSPNRKTCRYPHFDPSLARSVAHARIFRLGIGLGLVFMLRRTHASDGIIGAGSQINVEVIHVAGDIRIIAERGHHVLLRRGDVLA